jgi:hypothetical protein
LEFLIWAFNTQPCGNKRHLNFAANLTIYGDFLFPCSDFIINTFLLL